MSMPINRIIPGGAEIPYIPTAYSQIEDKLDHFIGERVVITYTPRGFEVEQTVEGILEDFRGEQYDIPSNLNILLFHLSGYKLGLIFLDGAQADLDIVPSADGIIHSVKLAGI